MDGTALKPQLPLVSKLDFFPVHFTREKGDAAKKLWAIKKMTIKCKERIGYTTPKIDIA